ncbi:MAG TPA: alginate export family protein, partial [Candidatus Polarisedimenticolia bacterium]|nr:alginate export family protein [Candidatus Polarisedimenticolia bacterium]
MPTLRGSAIGLVLGTTLLLLPSARADEADVRWVLSGEARLRPEWRDNADLDAAADDDSRLGFMRLRVGFEAIVRKDYRLFVQAQDSRIAGEETSTASDQKNLDLHQGLLDITLTASRRLSLTVGRQEWSYGDERLIGAFGWDNVGRAFDGARLRYALPRFRLDGLWARISSVTTGAATTGSDLYGAYAQAAPRPGAEYEGYWLEFADHLAAPGETGATGDTRIDALGGRVKDRYGRLDLRAEAVMERGHEQGDSLSAFAAGAQAGLSWGQATTLRPFGGYDYASGDRDPADGRRQEFFNFFPTNHPHYGYIDYEGWRNLRSYYGGISVTRGRHFAQAKVHHFGLQKARGPWKSAGGAVLGFDPTGRSGTSVGREIDLTYRYAWRRGLSLEAGYSR